MTMKKIQLDESVLRSVISKSINEAIEDTQWEEAHPDIIETLKRIFINEIIHTEIPSDSDDVECCELPVTTENGIKLIFSFGYLLTIKGAKAWDVPGDYWSPSDSGCDYSKCDINIEPSVYVTYNYEDALSKGWELYDGEEIELILTDEETKYVNANAQIYPSDELICDLASEDRYIDDNHEDYVFGDFD